MKKILTLLAVLIIVIASIPLLISADSTEYISYIQLGTANYYSDAQTCATADNFTINMNVDLYSGIETTTLFIGEKLTDNPKEAIRDLVVYSGDEYADTTYITNKDGITYYKVGGYSYIIDYNSSGEIIGKHLEWNDGININGLDTGESFYLFATRDPRAGNPICYLKAYIQNTVPEQLPETYRYVCDNSGNVIDWNNNQDNYVVVCMISDTSYLDSDYSFVPFSNDNPSGHLGNTPIGSAFSSDSISVLIICGVVLLIIFIVLMYLSKRGKSSNVVEL